MNRNDLTGRNATTNKEIKTDYNNYSFTTVEEVQNIAIAVVVTAGAAYLFYEDIRGMIFCPVVWKFVRKLRRQKKQKERQRVLAKQFQDGMQSVCTALLAGFSMENAWKEAEREMEVLYGKQAWITQEFQSMNQAVLFHIPLEQTLQDFARRSGVEDILSFSEVFLFAKRQGANFVRIIENTTYHMKDKQETEEEIQILAASKKLEQKIMNVIPVLILTYLKITSGDYLSTLYGNLFGVLFMTGCLAAYGAALVLSDRILDIRV